MGEKDAMTTEEHQEAYMAWVDGHGSCLSYASAFKVMEGEQQEG